VPNPTQAATPLSSAKPSLTLDSKKRKQWNEFVKIDGKLTLLKTIDLGLQITTKIRRKAKQIQPTPNTSAPPTHITPARNKHPRRRIEICRSPPPTPRTLHLLRLAKKKSTPTKNIATKLAKTLKPTKKTHTQPTLNMTNPKPTKPTYISSSSPPATTSTRTPPTFNHAKDTRHKCQTSNQQHPSRPTIMHLNSKVQDRIVIFEKGCISQGEKISTMKKEKSNNLFTKSPNLPEPEKGKNSSDVTGWVQPITAANKENSPTDAFVTKYSTVTCDWPQGKILAASDESEEGGQMRD
jgi:hypothetical protein